MLNHIEMQGKIANARRGERGVALFELTHHRDFSTIKDRFLCVIPHEITATPFLDGAKDGRTVIVTGRLREKNGGAEIVCETADFVDGGKADGS